jgi:DNA polymerase zeta
MDVSLVKSYLQNQMKKLISGNIDIKDFIFYKQVKLGFYKEGRSLPPAAIVALKEMKRDPQNEPHYKEIIPYVVIYKSPKSRLVDMVIHPRDFMKNK